MIRLSGGTSSLEGRVEIFHDNVWGSICDNDWGMDEATVVCNQLGFPLATVADRSLEFGPGNGTIWNNFDCEGYESNLIECDVEWDGVPNECISHQGDAGVICSPIEEGAIRLFGDERRFEGGVEFYHNGKWGTVCDHGWSGNDAKVACRQLGYPKARYAITNAWQYYGFPREMYNLEDVGCDGYENYIKDCWPLDYTPGYCDKYDLAGLYCYENEDDDDDEGLSPEAIAGIVVASMFVLLIFMCVCAAVCSSKKKKRHTTTYARNNAPQVNAVYDVASDRASFGPYYAAQPGMVRGEETTAPFTPPAGYVPGYRPPGADAPPAYEAIDPTAVHDTLAPIPTVSAAAATSPEQPPALPAARPIEATVHQVVPPPTLTTNSAATPSASPPAYEVPVTVN